MTPAELKTLFAQLPPLHRQMLTEACEHYYYIAREEYSPGDGTASREQETVAELSAALR